jgi:DNA-binding transcriptional LysR family regulator
MSYDLELRDLKYFEKIAELGHLGKAAEKLHLSQPALTSCVRRLQESFGVPLFERVGRGIQLTRAGEVLLSRARSLRIATEEAVRDMGELSRGDAGQVRIGAAPSLAQLLLPASIRVFLPAAKGVNIKTVIAQNDLIRSSLRAGDLDFIISYDSRIEEDLEAHALLEDVVVVAASRWHEIFRKRPRLRDLVAREWVLASTSVASRQWLDQAFASRGLPPPKVKVETNLVALLPRLIAQTDLLGFMSRRYLRSDRRGSSLKEIELRETTMRRWAKVIYRRNRHLPPAAQRFLDLLCTSGKALFEEP